MAQLQAFDFTAAMRRLCVDITQRLPDFRHVRMGEVAVTFSQARRRVMHGLQAKLTPLRFEGGALTTTRGGRQYTIQRWYADEQEMLYVLSFYLPRFLEQTFREKLITVVHELYHISPAFDGDIRRLLEDYWRRVAAMAEVAARWGLPTIAGHIDKAKMWNIGGRYFSETAPWYLDAAEAALRAIAAHDLVVEINTAGLGRAHGESYPGPRLLRRCRELGIPVTISADAHKPADVARSFDQAAAILRAAGFAEIAILDDGRWSSTPLP